MKKFLNVISQYYNNGEYIPTKTKGDVKKVIKCEKCGKHHALYHDCNQNSISHGVVFQDDRKCYDWNCFLTKASSIYKIEERILDSYFNNSKVNPLFAYE